jgi:hypothetical protein
MIRMAQGESRQDACKKVSKTKSLLFFCPLSKKNLTIITKAKVSACSKAGGKEEQLTK